jgi:hypothetical protein
MNMPDLNVALGALLLMQFLPGVRGSVYVLVNNARILTNIRRIAPTKIFSFSLTSKRVRPGSLSPGVSNLLFVPSGFSSRAGPFMQKQPLSADQRITSNARQ